MSSALLVSRNNGEGNEISENVLKNLCYFIGFIIKFVHESTRFLILKSITKSLLFFYLNKAFTFLFRTLTVSGRIFI